MTLYILTKDAENDLRNIASYTVKNHGSKKLRNYKISLEDKFNEIGDESVVARQFSKNLPQVLVVRCEHHFIFFLSGKPAIIIAILHERMDMISRIRNRLSNE